MLYNAKRRAQLAGVPFDLTYEDMRWDDTCPCCGKEYVLGEAHRNNSPSIDKLIPERGYVLDNIVFCCSTCNRRKSDMTPKEMYQIADFFWEKIQEAIGARPRSED